MKKNILVMAVIFCSMLLVASCSAPRTYAPYALSTVSSVSLPALQHSLERKDYEILDTIKAEAVVQVSSRKGGFNVSAESGEFTNVCIATENGAVYDIANSKGTVRAGFIDGLNLPAINFCDGSSMASNLAAYRLINEVKATDADGVVAPSLYVTAEETGHGFFSRTVTYKVVISAKLIKLNTK
jgi:hypothetical protein